MDLNTNKIICTVFLDLANLRVRIDKWYFTTSCHFKDIIFIHVIDIDKILDEWLLPTSDEGKVSRETK